MKSKNIEVELVGYEAVIIVEVINKNGYTEELYGSVFIEETDNVPKQEIIDHKVFDCGEYILENAIEVLNMRYEVYEAYENGTDYNTDYVITYELTENEINDFCKNNKKGVLK